MPSSGDRGTPSAVRCEQGSRSRTSHVRRGDAATSTRPRPRTRGDRDPRAHPGPELVAAYGSEAQRAAIGAIRGATASSRRDSRSLASSGSQRHGLLMARATVRGYHGDPRCVIDVAERSRSRLSPRSRKNDGRRDEQLRGRALVLRRLECAGAWDEAIEFSRERGLAWAEMWHRRVLRAMFHLGEWDELRSEPTRSCAGSPSTAADS